VAYISGFVKTGLRGPGGFRSRKMPRIVGALVCTAMMTVGLATSSMALHTAQAAAASVVSAPASGGNAPAFVPPSLRKAVQSTLGSTNAAQLTTPDATWSQQAELRASDGASGEGFGTSVSISAANGARRH
jgi:hypothetical protein